MKDFNINENVKVKLTDYGREELLKSSENFRKMFPQVKLEYKLEYKLPKEDKDGYSTWQLWDLMHQLGHLCIMGCKPPFETTMKIP